MQRAPIVVILGHVDHGKTTLLDTLKKTRVAASEAGGITQSIGAYQLHYKDKKLTIIDTPGHAAFSAMRKNGATVADLAILVIAANDGVQPQTLEALEAIKQANIPYVVALNKIDLADANVTKTKTQLAEHESAVEGFGGTIPVVEISAKNGTHIPELLDMVFLVYDLSRTSDATSQLLEAAVIESQRDPHKGPLISVVIRSGSIHLEDVITANGIHGKVKALFDDQGKRVSEAHAGDPVQILGFNDIVPVGSVVQIPSKDSNKQQLPAVFPSSPTTRDISVDKDRDTFIIKADSVGTLTALSQSMPTNSDLISSGVGSITESDVLLAESTHAIIVGFRVKAPKSVAKFAENCGVVILTNPIIYKLLEDLIKPEAKQLPQKELGRAKIIKLFDIAGQTIAGCSVASGRLAVGDIAQIGTSSSVIKQIKKGKTNVTSAKVGEECGVLFSPSDGIDLNFSVGNDIIAFENKKLEAKDKKSHHD